METDSMDSLDYGGRLWERMDTSADPILLKIYNIFFTKLFIGRIGIERV